MKENRKPEILYSEPVEEIMGRPPKKILRWGTGLIFMVFFLFMILAWLIKYPDIIPATVEITTENPPVTLNAKISGSIKYLYVTDRQIVTSGKLLAVIETTASIEVFEQLKRFTDTLARPENLTVSFVPHFQDLGELQDDWALFQKHLSDYQSFIMNDFYGRKIISTNDEIKSIRQYIDRIRIKEKLFVENQALESKKYNRDSLLFSQNVFSESELERSKQAFIRVNIELQQVRLDHSAKLIELAQKNQLLQDYSITKAEEMERLLSVLYESFQNLNAQLKIWENNYLLTAPVGGMVTFTRFWHENQSVTANEPVINIVPGETGEYVGRMNLKMQRSGKVKIGQLVNIKLSGYPYLEYGMLRGIIKSISLVPAGDAYVIELFLPSGFKTLYGRELEFTQNMQGTAEIITEDTRLLQKIINPFRHLISRNQR